MDLPILRLKKNEDRRLRAGHLWIFSNEIDMQKTPIKQFTAGEEVLVQAQNGTSLGVAYINPHSLIAARIFSHELNDRLDIAFFKNRIAAALSLRMQLYPKPYYRLIFGESDFLPGLVIDRFADIFVVQINTLGMDKKTESILSALHQVFPELKGILLRNDNSSRKLEGLESFVKLIHGEIPPAILLEENETRFYAPLSEGQKTGWFYDHRLNRSRLAAYVQNQRVLDVFSYLGGWGVQAAHFGAKEVFCLDASPLSTAWIPKNAELNAVADKIHVIQEDAFVGLRKLQQDKEAFDVIILDPPAFIKRQKDKKEGVIAYQRINEMALKLLRPGGILISCSCSQHLTHEELVTALRRASQHVNATLQILERGHQAPDHPVHLAIPETDYLKMVLVRKL